MSAASAYVLGACLIVVGCCAYFHLANMRETSRQNAEEIAHLQADLAQLRAQLERLRTTTQRIQPLSTRPTTASKVR